VNTLEHIVKTSVAIIIPGGIGTGHNNIGVPVLERIIKLLSVDFDLTVFQLYRINKNYTVTGFDLIGIHSGSPVPRSLKFLWIFFKVHRQRKFKAVHGFWAVPCGFLAVLVGKLFKIKSIVSLLGGDAISLPDINYGQLRSPLYRTLTVWTLHGADEANALTHYVTKNLKEAGVYRQDLKIIPWGIDTTLFAFKEKPVSKPMQFLHIANLHPVKDQETLLRGFRIICNKIPAHLTIIGEGVSEAKVRSLIVSLNLLGEVTLVGLQPYEELPSYYGRADIMLHTSLSEGQSEVVTEAMSSGVLVCGTSVGLIDDLTDCSVGVPVGDYQALAEKVLQLITEPSRMKTIRENARMWTNTHSIQWTTGQIKELYIG